MLSVIKGPYLQWPTLDSITVMWETSEASSSSVTYCPTRRVHEGLLGRYESLREHEKTVEDVTSGYIHAVTLTGLTPDTTFHYRVIPFRSDNDVNA